MNLPDIVIRTEDLSALAHLAATIQIKENTKLLSHSEIQVLIHLKALERYLTNQYVQPNFEVKL